MIGQAVGLGAAAWIGWAWLPHLATPVCTWRGPRGRRHVALTFDDGPDPEWTPRVLDLLAAAGVHAGSGPSSKVSAIRRAPLGPRHTQPGVSR